MPRRNVPYPFDFLGGVTDKRLLLFDTWRRCINHAVRLQARGRGQCHDPAGEQELRRAVSRYLAFSRAVASNWQNVIVTHGAQQAIDLTTRVVLRPGDVVAVEEPGYPPARAAFAAAAGIHMSARLKGSLKEKHLTGGALDPSIGLYGVSAFYMNQPAQEGLIFGYGGIESDDIDTAMKKLKTRLSKMTLAK